MTTARYALQGLTCASCLAEVLEHVHTLPGVTEVAVDLVVGGRSRLSVTSATTLPIALMRETLEGAGFDVTAASDTPGALTWRLGRP